MNIELARVPAPREFRTDASAGPAVMHVVGSFMPPSEHWVHDQIRNVRSYRCVVAASRLDNPAAHPWSPIYSSSLLPPHARLFERVRCRLSGVSPFLRSVSRAEQAVLWHAHSGTTAACALDAARRDQVLLVTSFYGTDMWRHRDGVRGLSRRYARLFEYGAIFLAEGPAAAAQLVRIGAPAARVRIHRLGVPVAVLPFAERHPAPGTLRVLMAARFVEKKGLPYGVEAFCRAAALHAAMRLTIVGSAGGGRSDRIRRQLDSIIERHGMNARVTWHAFMPRAELLDLALQHDVLLHPSVQGKHGDSEGGHPVVMTLLAATGMPIIATHHCDIPQIVLDGVTGWLCAERDVACLETALLAAVEDPGWLVRMGRSARAHVTTHYDLARFSLDSIYDEALSQRGAVPQDRHALERIRTE